MIFAAALIHPRLSVRRSGGRKPEVIAEAVDRRHLPTTVIVARVAALLKGDGDRPAW